jgi:hypothetical protein
MIDRPNASRLLGAMAATLTEHVVPATDGGARHSARVVANLCRILEREFELGSDAADATRGKLAELLDHDGSLEELVAVLDQRLRDANDHGRDEPEKQPPSTFESRAHSVLMADVRRRIAIDKPGYDT